MVCHFEEFRGLFLGYRWEIIQKFFETFSLIGFKSNLYPRGISEFR